MGDSRHSTAAKPYYYGWTDASENGLPLARTSKYREGMGKKGWRGTSRQREAISSSNLLESSSPIRNVAEWQGNEEGADELI